MKLLQLSDTDPYLGSRMDEMLVLIRLSDFGASFRIGKFVTVVRTQHCASSRGRVIQYC